MPNLRFVHETRPPPTHSLHPATLARAGVFTTLVEAFGTKHVEVTELLSLDHASLAALEHIHGLVFLFKYDESIPDHRPVQAYGGDGGVYFANQVITNACATQALIHVLLNAEGVELGPTLTDLKEFTQTFPPEMRGESLESSHAIRTAHNSFARSEPFITEARKSSSDDDEDAFHFVAFVPVAGKVYELDGLKRGPILVGDVPSDGPWWQPAIAEIQRKAEAYAASELRFNLMAVCRSQRAILQEELAAASAHLAAVEAGQSAPAAASAEASAAAPAFEVAATEEERAVQKEQLQARITAAQEGLAADDAKRQEWEAEHVRRRHNYVPLAVALFKYMASKGQLQPAFEAAREKTKAAVEAARARRAARKATAEAADVTP